MNTAPTLFTDTETTGLDPRIHHVWEIAVIRRDPDGIEHEHLWQVRPDLTSADPKALEIGRYHQRFAVPDSYDAARFSADGELLLKLTLPEFLFDLQDVLNGDRGVMVGSNPAFDDTFIKKLLWANERTTKWHYRTIDVATLAAGFLYGQAERMTQRDCDAKWYGKVAQRIGWPWKSYAASEAAGVPQPTAEASHTALGDARWARDLYDQVTIPNAFYAASDEQLSQMASEALSRFHGGAA